MECNWWTKSQESGAITTDWELDGTDGGQDTRKKLRKMINHLKSDGKNDKNTSVFLSLTSGSYSGMNPPCEVSRIPDLMPFLLKSQTEL